MATRLAHRTTKHNAGASRAYGACRAADQAKGAAKPGRWRRTPQAGQDAGPPDILDTLGDPAQLDAGKLLSGSRRSRLTPHAKACQHAADQDAANAAQDFPPGDARGQHFRNFIEARLHDPSQHRKD